MDRRGDWMVTATGRQYWPLDPRAADVHIEDIATQLAKECRFNGACSGHYSVAEHSVHVSRLVPVKWALHGLLHDAPEAYIKDITRPVKHGLGSTYGDIEELNWLAICEWAGIDPNMPPAVKQADDAMLLTERDQIMPRGGLMWSIKGEPAQVIVAQLEWREARTLFLHRYREITHRLP